MSFGKGGGGSSIPSIDPSALIAQQGQQNRITQFTPQGNQIFGTIGANGQFVPSTGEDQQALFIEESPFQQFARQGSEDLAATLLQTAAPRIQNLPLSPIDTTQLPERQFNLDLSGVQGVPTADQFGDLQSQAEQAVFQRGLNLLNPEFDRQQQLLDQKLANQGLPMGSAAFTGEQNRFGQQRNRTLENLALQSVGAGNALQNQLFGQALTGRNAQIQDVLNQAQFGSAQRAGALQEQQALRSTELGELASLLGLQQVNPVGIQNFLPPAGVDVSGPYQLAQNAAAQRASLDQQQQNSILGGLFGLGAAAIL